VNSAEAISPKNLRNISTNMFTTLCVYYIFRLHRSYDVSETEIFVLLIKQN